MCGICGQYNYTSHTPVYSAFIYGMTASLQHRGPDSEGYHISENIGLGIRRLAIIDIAGGSQPIFNSHRNIYVICNGELYNYLDLRRKLINYGHRFYTNSDTEVILHGYEEWGTNVLSFLNGMFAFSLWDEKEKTLFLARDPMGIKPLYYLDNGISFLFSSEIKSLLLYNEYNRELDSKAIVLYLKYKFVPAPFTIYKNIHKLAAGFQILIRNNSVKIKKWWDKIPVIKNPPIRPAEAEEELSHLYSIAIKRQLVSDVPVGLLLSGGVDSGLLLALSSKYNSLHNTFTVGYGNIDKRDELASAAAISKMYGVNNQNVVLDQDSFDSIFAETVKILEEPIASSSIVAMVYLSKLVSESVKVALMGQGLDELFAGYQRHLGIYYSHYMQYIPQKLNKLIIMAIPFLKNKEFLYRSVHSLYKKERIELFKDVLSIISDKQLYKILRKEICIPETGDVMYKNWNKIIDDCTRIDILSAFQHLEVKGTLPDELLLYADKISMAFGLEVRVPYLDIDVVKYIQGLPPTFKIHGIKGKWLHKRICRKYLPSHIISHSKIGFTCRIVDNWFKTSHKGHIGEMLLDPHSAIYNYLHYKQVLRILKEHKEGQYDHHKLIFSLIVLQQWLVHFSNHNKRDEMIVRKYISRDKKK